MQYDELDLEIYWFFVEYDNFEIIFFLLYISNGNGKVCCFNCILLIGVLVIGNISKFRNVGLMESIFRLN